MKMEKSVIFVKKKLEDKHTKYKKYKLGSIIIIKKNIDVLNIAYEIQSIVYLKNFL